MHIQRGVEQEAVLNLLMSSASPDYQLRSAFTRGSIHGYVYLEATMNPKLVNLLKRIPGIRRESRRLQWDSIPQEDWEALLMMPTPVVGEWVNISRGKYKGDLAYVSSLEDRQGVDLLLIPRLAYGDKRPPSTKRKRDAYRPPPRLFVPNLVPKGARIQPVEVREGVYKYRSLRLENGLVRQSFDLRSISQGVLHMPNDVFATFQESKHRELLEALYPCPAEFKFEEEELVLVLPTSATGRITTLRQREAEVTLLNGEGDVNVSWTNMRKYVVVGDYVEIVSGMYQGQQGFVMAAQGDNITVSQFERALRRAVGTAVKVNSHLIIAPLYCTKGLKGGGSPRQLGQGHNPSAHTSLRGLRCPAFHRQLPD
jgi:transcription antitermination factor NusG